MSTETDDEAGADTEPPEMYREGLTLTDENRIYVPKAVIDGLGIGPDDVIDVQIAVPPEQPGEPRGVVVLDAIVDGNEAITVPQRKVDIYDLDTVSEVDVLFRATGETVE